MRYPFSNLKEASRTFLLATISGLVLYVINLVFFGGASTSVFFKITLVSAIGWLITDWLSKRAE